MWMWAIFCHERGLRNDGMEPDEDREDWLIGSGGTILSKTRVSELSPALDISQPRWHAEVRIPSLTR